MNKDQRGRRTSVSWDGSCCWWQCWTMNRTNPATEKEARRSHINIPFPLFSLSISFLLCLIPNPLISFQKMPSQLTTLNFRNREEKQRPDEIYGWGSEIKNCGDGFCFGRCDWLERVKLYPISSSRDSSKFGHVNPRPSSLLHGRSQSPSFFFLGRLDSRIGLAQLGLFYRTDFDFISSKLVCR